MQMQENNIRSNFIAANLPPPEIPPQPPTPGAATRRRERDLTDVDYAHMEAVFKIRDIYRRRGGAMSYAEIAKYQFDNHFRDRLTVDGIVQVSVQTLTDHAKKKKSWPPSRWRTAYNHKTLKGH